MNYTTFATNDGTAWPLSLSFAKVRELRDTFGVDLLADRDAGQRLAELFGDGPKLAAVLWQLVQDDWRIRFSDIDAETFFGSLDCDTITAGGEALVAAFRAFLPDAKAGGDGTTQDVALSPWQVAFSLAGIAGVDLWPLSFRELAAATEQVQSERWDHTAALRCEIHNAAFGRKRGKSFREMHPMIDRKPKSRLSKAASGRLLDSVFGAWRDR